MLSISVVPELSGFVYFIDFVYFVYVIYLLYFIYFVYFVYFPNFGTQLTYTMRIDKVDLNFGGKRPERREVVGPCITRKGCSLYARPQMGVCMSGRNRSSHTAKVFSRNNTSYESSP